MSELITYIKIILFYGKLLRGQEGRICIMRCHSATWGKYISNTSLATGRITLQTAYPPGFSTTTFIFLCAHRNAKSLYPSKTISLHLFFCPSLVRIPTRRNYLATFHCQNGEDRDITTISNRGQLYTSGDWLCMSQVHT